MKLQLATNLLSTDPLSNSKFVVQQKLDGHRVAVSRTATALKSFNRYGSNYALPNDVRARLIDAIPVGWVLDGELVGSDYFVFDAIRCPENGALYALPLLERLDVLYDRLSGIPSIQIVPTVGHKHKRDFIQKCFLNRVEGVLLKDLESRYHRGQRHPSWQKYKFIKDVDVVVMAVNQDGKRNLVLGAYDGERLVEVGRCSALTGDGPRARVGDVVTVRVLYVSADDRLVQPTLPTLRDDKMPNDCLLEQLKYLKSNKDIIIP